MVRLLFLAMLGSGSIASILRPWIGVVIAYGFAILTPQAIWYWAFDGIRPVLWIFVPTIIGVVLAGLAGKLDFRALANSRALCIALLWLMFWLSYLFGPYVNVPGPFRFHDPGWIMETISKILFLFFISCICINSELKLKALVWVAVGSLLYLIYWANDQYLSGHMMGRLSGPSSPTGGSIYLDENTFALVFVVLLPYLWHLSNLTQKSWAKWGLRLAIPLAWHAVFLTASRGGLVGLAVVTLVMAVRSKARLLGVLLIPALIVAYFWQAGDLMKERAGTIDEYRQEASAATRLEAWSAARAMMAEYPLLGVGLASFGPAFPNYSPYEPREAHNTFFQIAAESGVLAGFLFLAIAGLSIVGLWRSSRRLAARLREQRSEALFLYSMSEATLAAMIGFFVCSMFLSLQLYEIFYFLCVVTNVVIALGLRLENTKPATRQAVEAERLSTGRKSGEFRAQRRTAEGSGDGTARERNRARVQRGTLYQRDTR